MSVPSTCLHGRRGHRELYLPVISVTSILLVFRHFTFRSHVGNIVTISASSLQYSSGCPRPMYHYDPTTGGIPPGFPSAINLSVKCVAAAQAQAQVQAQAQMKSAEPTSPGGSVMDLSTSSVTSTSPQVRLLCSAFSRVS